MLSIRKAAAEAGVGIDTVRFYKRAGASEKSFGQRQGIGFTTPMM